MPSFHRPHTPENLPFTEPRPDGAVAPPPSPEPALQNVRQRHATQPQAVAAGRSASKVNEAKRRASEDCGGGHGGSSEEGANWSEQWQNAELGMDEWRRRRDEWVEQRRSDVRERRREGARQEAEPAPQPAAGPSEVGGTRAQEAARSPGDEKHADGTGQSTEAKSPRSKDPPVHDPACERCAQGGRKCLAQVGRRNATACGPCSYLKQKCSLSESGPVQIIKLSDIPPKPEVVIVKKVWKQDPRKPSEDATATGSLGIAEDFHLLNRGLKAVLKHLHIDFQSSGDEWDDEDEDEDETEGCEE
ncbi:hypothetical protein PQX77_018754 [Marasmius sp. AFHP31]|nr:hypothetical protein PQX77_018754 [Marasmius sp. AFHP31]